MQGVAIYLLAVVWQAKCISDFLFAILIGENLTQSHFFYYHERGSPLFQ